MPPYSAITVAALFDFMAKKTKKATTLRKHASTLCAFFLKI